MAESNNSVVTNNENTPKSSKSGQNSEVQDKNKTENVLRPLLLEDYKYEESPESLQNLLKFFETSGMSSSRVDILVGLIYVLMLEAGFVPINYNDSDMSIDFSYKRVNTLSFNVPFAGQRRSKSYCIRMCLPSFQQFEVKLAIVNVSDDLVVNCFVKGIESGNFNILIDPLTYFTSSNTNLTIISFQQLDHLSRKVKGQVAFPVKYSILKQNGIALPCLEDLPSEVVLIIMKKLPLVDLVQFGKTSSKFSVLMRGLLKKFGKKMQ